jgi:hypothetical protein
VQIHMSNSDGFTTMVPSMANRVEKVFTEETVVLKRLDDFAFEGVNFIKVDVEGAEAMVIAGAVTTLQKHHPVLVFESWRTVDDSAAFSLLRGIGYLFFAPTWETKEHQRSISITEAIDPHQMVLVQFDERERTKLPERVNVVAIPSDAIERLSSSNI